MRRWRLTDSVGRWVAAGLVVAAAVAGCGQDGSDSTAELRAAVEAYSGAYLSGDAEAAYGLLSTRCRERLSRAEMAALTSAAQDLYGGAEITSYEAETSGEFARVTYRYEDYPAIDQESEPWVFERGSWRQDDC